MQLNTFLAKLMGLSLIAISFAVGVIWASAQHRRLYPHLLDGGESSVSWDSLKLDPKNIDVLQLLQVAKSRSVRPDLVRLTASPVEDDGRVDLTQLGASIRIVLSSPRGAGPQPIGSQGVPERRIYCGQQLVRADAKGLHFEEDRPKHRCAGSYQALDMPSCSLAVLAKKATEREEAKTKGAAIAEIYSSVSGTTWRLSYPRNGYSLAMPADCSRELKQSESVVSQN